MNPRYEPRRTRYRALEWVLLAVAVAFALIFVAALAYMGYAFSFAVSKGFEENTGMAPVFALLLPISLVISIAASISLAYLERKHRHTLGVKAEK
jgi:hypothetical protein